MTTPLYEVSDFVLSTLPDGNHILLTYSEETGKPYSAETLIGNICISFDLGAQKRDIPPMSIYKEGDVCLNLTPEEARCLRDALSVALEEVIRLGREHDHLAA